MLSILRSGKESCCAAAMRPLKDVDEISSASNLQELSPRSAKRRALPMSSTFDVRSNVVPRKVRFLTMGRPGSCSSILSGTRSESQIVFWVLMYGRRQRDNAESIRCFDKRIGASSCWPSKGAFEKASRSPHDA